MKIRHKIFFISVLLSITPLLIWGVVSYHMTTSSMTQAIVNGLQSTADSRVRDILHIVQLRQEQAKELAGAWLVRQLNSNGNNKKEEIDAIQYHVNSVFAKMKEGAADEGNNVNKPSQIDCISIVDINGNILIDTDSIDLGTTVQKEYLEKVKTRDLYFGGIVRDSSAGKNVLLLLQSIHNYDDNQFSGAVVLTIDSKILDEVMMHTAGLGEEGDAFLIDKNFSRINISGFDNKKIPVVDTKMTRDCMLGKETIGIYKNHHGKNVIGVSKYIKELNWGLIVEIDQEEALASMYSLKNLSILLGIIFILILAVLANYIAKYFSDPVEQLTGAFQNISKGVLVNTAKLSSNDEFSKLSEIANETINRLKRFTEESKKIASGTFHDLTAPLSQKDELGWSLQFMADNMYRFDKQHSDNLWIEKGINDLATNLKAEKNVETLCHKILHFVIPYMEAEAGSVYIYNQLKNRLEFISGYSSNISDILYKKFEMGESLVGKSALEKKIYLYNNADKDYIRSNYKIRGNQHHLMIVPLVSTGILTGVVEIVSKNKITHLHQELMERLAEILSFNLSAALDHLLIENLLEESEEVTEKFKERNKELEKVQLELSQQITCLNISAIVSETDAEGNITFVNDFFCKISEYSREELMGNNHRLLKSGKQPDGLFIGMWKAISMGKSWNGEIVNRKKGGDFYWVDTTIMPFKDTFGNIIKYVAIRFDITERKAQQKKLEEQSDELKVQHEELVQNNQELNENRELLEEQNKALQVARDELHRKARELEMSSKYKSEFLANMSHELRTPLNSILLLSQLLAENDERNLSDEQIEFANVINESGRSLLELINEVLDLSKIEAGKMEIHAQDVPTKEICKKMTNLFKPMAIEKGISYNCIIEDNIPDTFITDAQRLEQIIKNLLSNAVKFTANGGVTLYLYLPAASTLEGAGFTDKNAMLAIEVTDTGIGIPEEKIALVFEAFQQADGSTQRNYGGTGLGLSISRNLANMLGGTLTLKSEVNKGSTFTLLLPLDGSDAIEQYHDSKMSPKKEIEPIVKSEPIAPKTPSEIPDDRDQLKKGDKVFLIVEDDTDFAGTILHSIHKKGYKGIISVSGSTVLDYAKKYKPMGILLDLVLPEKSGWTVMKELKEDKETRRIPVFTMSSENYNPQLSISSGALDFVNKPLLEEQLMDVITRLENDHRNIPRKILMIDDNKTHFLAVEKFIGNSDKNFIHAVTAKEGMMILENDLIDLVILDMDLPDAPGYELLESIRNQLAFIKLPIITYTDKSLSLLDEKKIKSYANTIVIKTADSFQRLLDEVTFFLRVPHRENSHPLRERDPGMEILSDKNVLIVDDDVRNIFSLTKILEAYDMKVISASNGKEALSILENHSAIQIVLMDMMMPEMDGYEAIKAIRKENKWRNLPIIAVTAKSMMGDRAQCIDAGASDYISKPIDSDKLVSLMKIWFEKI